MRLFIMEKPDMANRLARVMGKSIQREDGYLLVGNDAVTWCIGHLLELIEPEEYDPAWKKWSFEYLPIVPERFRLKPIKGKEGQLYTIKQLLDQADEVIHGGDIGREGQLIVDEVLRFLKNRSPVKRLVLNNSSPEGIRKALANLEDNKKHYPKGLAAKARSEADWIYGMSLSRAATLAFGGFGTVLSIGRVQTPTLALVVNRCVEIENFQPENFYELIATAVSENGEEVQLLYGPPKDARIKEKSVANTLAKEVKGTKGTFSVQAQDKKKGPPKLFSLAGLQKEAGKKLKYGAQQVLEIAQSLYEQGLITYPRTEATCLPSEIKSEVPVILKGLKESTPSVAQIYQESGLEDQEPVLRNSIFNDKKMEKEEHHAIIPTGMKLSEALDKKAENIYLMVVRRFLMSLLPDYEYRETQITLPATLQDGRTLPFAAKGLTPVKLGWRVLEDAETKESLIPNIKDGEQGELKEVKVKTRKTTPPPYYIEGTLLEDMSAIAKYVTDERIKSALKETSGIGTPATQAAIIETLKARKFIKVEPRSGKVKDTPEGRELILSLPKLLTNPDITAKWEMDLKKIALGHTPPENFKESVIKFVDLTVEWFENNKGAKQITIEKQKSAKENKSSSSNSKTRKSKEEKSA